MATANAQGPLAWKAPPVANPATPSDQGRAGFRLEAMASAAAQGETDRALALLGTALEAYDSTLPPHDVVDSARRALHIALAASLLGDALPPATRDRAAAAVSHHLVKVEQNLPKAAPARCDALTSWGAAALVWPSLPESRHVWSQALQGLETVGHARANADGTPNDAGPAEVLAWVEAALILGRAARAEGVAVPQGLAGAVGAASWHLYIRAYPEGPLPADAVGPVLADSSILAPAARDATLALGWSGGRAAAEHPHGELASWLGGAASEARELTSSADWAMWSFRDGPVIVAHGRSRAVAARGVVDGSQHPTPTPAVAIAGLEVVGDQGSGIEVSGVSSRGTLELVQARTDPRQARVVFEDQSNKRDIVFRQARVVVLDKPSRAGRVSAWWEILPGWEVARTDRGLEASHPGAEKPVKLSVDERLEWTLSGQRLAGTGDWDGDEPLRTTIEWT